MSSGARQIVYTGFVGSPCFDASAPVTCRLPSDSVTKHTSRAGEAIVRRGSKERPMTLLLMILPTPYEQ